MFSNILNLFPEKEHLKLSKATEIPGRFTKEMMEDLEALEEKREDANRLNKDKGAGGGSGIKSHPTTQQTNPKHTQPGCPQPGRSQTRLPNL